MEDGVPGRSARVFRPVPNRVGPAVGLSWLPDRHTGLIPHRHDRVRLETPVGNEHGRADPTPTVVFVEGGERTWTWTWTLR